MSKSMPPAPLTPDKDPYLGAVINDHITLGRLLGTGGMSRVYATVPTPGHPVRAVKLLNTDLGQVAEAVARFQREADIMMKLEHPNIVQVFESGVAKLPPFNGIPFVVMKLVRGKTLEEMMDELRDAGSNGRIPFEQAIIYISQVCAGLIDAHEKGIIHRDIKPSNVFVETHPGVTQVLITDWGIGCFQDQHVAKVTLADRDEVMGTPPYMAPEQAAGERALTVKVDVYALGVMAYELLSGRMPIEEQELDTAHSYLVRVIIEQPVPLKHRMPGITDLLNELVMGCLAKDPADRPTVRQFRDGLAHATGARLNASVRPSVDAQELTPLSRVDLTPPRVPLDVVPPRAVTAPFGSVTGSAPLPLLSRKTAEDPLDTAKKTERKRSGAVDQRLISTDPPSLPMRRLPVWAWLLILLSGIGAAVAIVAAAIDARVASNAAAAGAEHPRSVRAAADAAAPLSGAAVARRPDAGTVTVVAVAAPRDAGIVHPDASTRRAVAPPVVRPVPLPPPDPRVAEVNAHGAACMAALGSRPRPAGWRDRCRAYAAARCPATGVRAVDCDLIETMLRRTAPRPRSRHGGIEDDDEEDVEDEEAGEPTP
ncbi:serine/threonine protein kinase [Patescibacteria group bacterium]|nr:MAG: serine/threonine protein kinase [Patescibacteria group bacterium]